MRACPLQTQGPWSAQSMARLPPLRSQPACCQDRVLASGADAVLCQQAGEKHNSTEARLCQMEAQLEEKNKELQRVHLLTGRQCLGRRHSLGGASAAFLHHSRLCHRVCACVASSADPGTHLLGSRAKGGHP